MVRALFMSLVLVAAVGCGSSGESQAESDCNSFFQQTVCPKLVNCDVGYTTVSSCIAAFNQQGICTSVTSENGNLGLCESDLNALTCDQFVDTSGDLYLPPSCSDVFTKPQT